jgi:hypothetical protein
MTWQEKDHPRDGQGQFTESWASGVLGQMGLLDPETAAGLQRHSQWIADTLDAVDGILGERGQDPYWMNDQYEHLQNLMRTIPGGFERDPRVYRAQMELLKFNPYGESTPLLPWKPGVGTMTDEQTMAAYPYWRGEVARRMRREGYNLDAVEAHLQQAGKKHLLTDEAGYREFNKIDRPQLMTKFLVKELERETASTTHLRTADVVYDARMDGERGGKQMMADDLDVHPDFATSGDYEIWLDGAWHQLEEVYHDNPDEEEIEVIAGDQHRMIDTSDEIELRRVATPRRRAWWE